MYNDNNDNNNFVTGTWYNKYGKEISSEIMFTVSVGARGRRGMKGVAQFMMANEDLSNLVRKYVL